MASHHAYSRFTFRGNLLDQARFFIFILCVLCALSGEFAAQDFKAVYDGVEYAEVTREFSGKPVKLNLLRLDLKKVRLDVHHALDAAIGTEKTSSIATRHGAIAAINGGFFRLDTSIWAGDPAGILMIDGKLWSESTKSRIVIMISNGIAKTDVNFGHLDVEPFVAGNRSRPLFIDGINRERRKDEIIMYTPEFGRTTMTDPTGKEIVVQNGRVISITNAGSNRIPINGVVLSAHGNALINLDNVLQIGERVRFLKNSSVAKVEDATNGLPQLIKNSKIDITWEQEKSSKSFVETRHPRTAVAKLKDGKFLMITVDGRSEASGGIGLQDLAEYLLSLGATDAMNLDGGGSTTMFVDGRVVNKPSDKEGERKVSDAILVTLRSNTDQTKKKSPPARAIRRR